VTCEGEYKNRLIRSSSFSSVVLYKNLKYPYFQKNTLTVQDGLVEGIMIQNPHESIPGAKMFRQKRVGENVLFSNILNHNPLDTGKVVNSRKIH